MTDACPNFGLFVVEVFSLNMGEFYLVEDAIWGLEGGDDDCGFALSIGGVDCPSFVPERYKQ